MPAQPSILWKCLRLAHLPFVFHPPRNPPEQVVTPVLSQRTTFRRNPEEHTQDGGTLYRLTKGAGSEGRHPTEEEAMTMRRARRFGILIGAVLVISLTGPGVSIARSKPGHVQSCTTGPERFLGGPFDAGTRLAISSLTVHMPSETLPDIIHLRVIAGGDTGSCPDYVGASPPVLSMKVPDRTRSISSSRNPSLWGVDK